ncbi:DddA-like double-stranded DNA deaminase toxin [Micromonospora sp. NPDC003197]
MSIAEIGAALQAVVDAVTEQRKGLVHVADSLQQARDRFHAITATSGHHLVGETLRQQTQAIDRLREAETLLSAVPAALAEFATAIGATVRLVRQHRPTVPSSYGDSPMPVAVTSEPPVPAAVVRLAGWLTPWREGENVRGYAFDSDRRHLNNEPFSSGRLKAAAHGLRPVRGGGHPVTVTDHVEGHVAARLRAENGPRDVTLVINKAPCDDRPFGCNQLLPHVIPSGTRLTVYVVDASGLRLHRIYEGTGKGIAS